MKHVTYKSIHLFLWISFLIGCDSRKPSETNTSKADDLTTAVNSPRASISQNENITSDPPATADAKQNQIRKPKQKYSELVGSSDRLNPVGERLKQELAGLRPTDPASITKLTNLWEKNVAQLSSRPIPSVSDDAVARGVILPKELLPPVPVDIWKDTPEAMISGVSLAAAAGCNELLIKFVAQRANILPPTSVDVTIFEAINSVLDELSPTRQISAFEPWKQFGNSANPIYRLLALRASVYTTSKEASGLSIESDEFSRVDASAKLGFYLSYLDEKDPVILTEAIRVLSHVPLPEARQAIEKFHAQQLQKGDPVLIQAAEEALRTQKNISP